MFGMFQAEWWLVALRGLIAIMFGILALAWPTQTAAAIIVIIALFVLVDGSISLIAAARSDPPGWGFGIFEGVLGVVIGVLALVMPETTAMVFAALVGVWALIIGLLELVTALRMRPRVRTSWLLAALGVLSMLFGIAIIFSPSAGVVVFTVLVGFYAIFFGISLIIYGFRLRQLGGTPPV